MSSQLNKTFIRHPLITICAALLCSSAFIGCDIRIDGPPNHQISDSHNNHELKLFTNDHLVGRYVTGSSVSFTITRRIESEASVEDLAIESSDSTLLRIAEEIQRENVANTEPSCIPGGACDSLEDSSLEPALSSLTKRFDVLGTGRVTLTFRDGDEVILSRQIELVEASSLKLSRNIPKALRDEIASAAGEGEKVIIGKEFSLRLHAMTQSEGSESEIDISELTQLPNGEGFTIGQSSPYHKGVRLHITPRTEGELAIPVSMGGQSLEMNFTVVDASEVVSFIVDHELTVPANEEIEGSVDLGSAFAVAKDESGSPVYGADFIWERLEVDMLGTEFVAQSFSGDVLHFTYHAEARVPFKVTMGEHSKTVYLPIDPESFDEIGAGNAFADGCDARGDLSGSILLAFLLMGIMAIRRRSAA